MEKLPALILASLLVTQSAATALAQSPTAPALPNLRPEQPRGMIAGSIPNSVILRGGTHAETMQRLRVVRTYSLLGLRSNSQVTVGEARLDFRPMLDNPKALFNIAERLRAMPQHVEVKENTSEISEVEQGVVVHHVLTYRILPGKCGDAGAKAQLAGAGIECFTQASMNERVAGFSNPRDPRYVADPQKRQAAIAAHQRNSAIEEADANKGIADLRKALSIPTQRAAIVAQIGQAEAARMDRLADDQLKGELINSSVQHFEETMFVPKLESANYAHPQHALAIAPSTGEMQAVHQLLRDGVPEHTGGVPNFPKLLKVIPGRSFNLSPAAGGDRSADADLGSYIFLTGFTIGHDYEWHWGEQVTINWCIVGCSSTYGLELHAGFNYGFGLRFPIQAKFKYATIVHVNNSAEAKLTATFNPIQGTVDDFFSAGLPADQMYDAKEFVAQAGADAGFNLSLPGLNVNPDFKINVDFTEKLPRPFTGGKFQPPAPGTHGIDSDPIVFDGIDLLGGLLNYGVAGGQLLPAVKVNLHSDKLEFTLNDEIQRRQMRLTQTSQTVPVAVKAVGVGDDSHFSIGNAVYSLGLTLTPGLNPRVFVDIDVWSDHWDWQIWFPDLAVTVPANGVDFSCHAGTTCVVDFAPSYNASTGQVRDISREADAADRTLGGGGCKAVGSRLSGQPGNYVCPVKGMLGLCQDMRSNAAVASCGALVPETVDKALRYKNYCTGNDGNYVCKHDMMALCNTYLRNQEILSCKESK